jgi:hypothetical protein
MYRDQPGQRSARRPTDESWTSAEATSIELASRANVLASRGIVIGALSLLVACLAIAQGYYGWKHDPDNNPASSGSATTSAATVVPYNIDARPYSQPYEPTPRYRPPPAPNVPTTAHKAPDSSG